MGASPLYVYMYVALDNMLVLLSRSGRKKQQHKPTLIQIYPLLTWYTAWISSSVRSSIHLLIHFLMHPLIHLFIVQILHNIWEQSELWFIAYFSRSMPSGGKKNPKLCISLLLFSQNMVSEAKLCLLFQPQGSKWHLLSGSYLKYHYEYRNASFSSPCTDRFSNDETSVSFWGPYLQKQLTVV